VPRCCKTPNVSLKKVGKIFYPHTYLWLTSCVLWYAQQQTGVSVTVPTNPTARLQYYFSCMLQVIDSSVFEDQADSSVLNRLCDYRNGGLGAEEVDLLLMLCVLLQPSDLLGKVLIPSDEMCGASTNEFFELTAVRSTMAVTESVVIGGRATAVHKVMAFKKSWLETYYLHPMRSFHSRLQRIASGAGGHRPPPYADNGNYGQLHSPDHDPSRRLHVLAFLFIAAAILCSAAAYGGDLLGSRLFHCSFDIYGNSLAAGAFHSNIEISVQAAEVCVSTAPSLPADAVSWLQNTLNGTLSEIDITAAQLNAGVCSPLGSISHSLNDAAGLDHDGMALALTVLWLVPVAVFGLIGVRFCVAATQKWSKHRLRRSGCSTCIMQLFLWAAVLLCSILGASWVWLSHWVEANPSKFDASASGSGLLVAELKLGSCDACMLSTFELAAAACAVVGSFAMCKWSCCCSCSA
jgi:hypothetical protein